MIPTNQISKDLLKRTMNNLVRSYGSFQRPLLIGTDGRVSMTRSFPTHIPSVSKVPYSGSSFMHTPSDQGLMNKLKHDEVSETTTTKIDTVEQSDSLVALCRGNELNIAQSMASEDALHRIAVITMNHPRKRNVLSQQMIQQLRNSLNVAMMDSSVRCVILAAEGPAFSAGHDLKELVSISSEELQSLFSTCGSLMTDIMRAPKPVIAQVHATAAAAGCQLAAACDMVIASKSASFSTPGVNVGLFCSTPGVAISRSIGKKHAMEMLLTGKPVSAERAEMMGLVNQVVSGDRAALEQATVDLAIELTQKDPEVIQLGKAAFYRQAELGVDDAYSFASGVMVENINCVGAARDGIQHFLSRKKTA